jgi:RNA polymerase sigma factor (sigma-70 family)
MLGPGFFPSMNDLCQRLSRDLDGAFPDLVGLLRQDIYSGLRRLHPAEAEDLTQETLIRAYRALAGYEPERIRQLQLRGWIWTIALNLGRNHARDRARRPQPVEYEDRHPMTDPEPPDSIAWDRRLRGLPPQQRQAVVLRHVVGLSYPEIAEVVARPEGTVKADVHRGLQKLRQIMEEEV